MRMRILSIIFMMAALGCNAAGVNYRVVYDFEYTKDSINSIKGKDILYLELSESSSFCFSYYSYQTDSLMNEPDGRKIWRELFAAAIAKDGVNATSFPHKRSTFMIAKYNNSDTISVKDVIDNEVYKYDISKNEFVWQLCDSVKNINGYESYMAVCNYHGREWTVWFTPEIPFSDGPWAFCGLPGLILSAQDKEGLFSFSMIGFSSCQDRKRDWTGEGKETDRVTFLKKKYQYLKNMDSTLNAEMGMSISCRKDTRYLDGLEPDFK